MVGMMPYHKEEILDYLRKNVPGLTLVDSKRAEQELHDPMIEKHWDEMTKTRQDEYLAYLKGIPVEYPPSVNI